MAPFSLWGRRQSGGGRVGPVGSPEAPGWRSMEEPEPELGWACDSNRGP